MKTFILSFALLFIANFMNAAILRCSATATGLNTYATAQAAHDAATAGDTIHLEPIQFGNYGDLNISKKIVLISTGDFISQNPNTQARTKVGSCGNVGLNNGSENSVISAKCDYLYIFVSNIIITHSSCSLVYIANNQYALALSNILVSKSYINQCLITEGYNTPYQAIADVIITNNIISGYCLMTGYSAASISNNLIYNTNSTVFRNSVLDNNIFYDYGNAYTFNNCTGSNNITNTAIIPSNLGNNNVSNVDFSTVLLNWGAFNGDNYQLNPSYSNQTVGPYAGSDPYRPACQPAVPAIYQLAIPSVNAGNTLPIQVSTKSNN